MNKKNVLLYSFVLVAVIKVGLWYPTRQLSNDTIEMSQKSADLENEMEKFKTFDDSLAGNPNFRRRILENVSTPEELQQLRENQGHELKKKFKDFRDTYPDSENMIMKHKILDGLDNLLSVVFVCMAIPLFIYLFKER